MTETLWLLAGFLLGWFCTGQRGPSVTLIAGDYTAGARSDYSTTTALNEADGQGAANHGMEP